MNGIIRRPRVGRICDKVCIMPFIFGRSASAARRPRLRPHALDLASNCKDHSDASAACVGRNAVDYELILRVHFSDV